MKTVPSQPRYLPVYPLTVAPSVSDEKPPLSVAAIQQPKEILPTVNLSNAMDKPENWDEAWFGNYE